MEPSRSSVLEAFKKELFETYGFTAGELRILDTEIVMAMGLFPTAKEAVEKIMQAEANRRRLSGQQA